MAAKPAIEFVEIRQAYASDGGPRAASYYVYLVAGKEVAVEVTKSAVMTRDGDLPEEKTKVAVQTFLESELERVGHLPENLVLDEPAMVTVLHRLGWPSRF
jgi:hypothetical protein